MENLFYKQTVSQTYDLKGIGAQDSLLGFVCTVSEANSAEGRKVPKTVVEGSTLFDSEWIEGQSKAPILLQPRASLFRLCPITACRADAQTRSGSCKRQYTTTPSTSVRRGSWTTPFCSGWTISGTSLSSVSSMP